MGIFSGIDVQDSLGVDISEYQMLFDPGLTNFSGNLFGFLTQLVYVCLQFIAAIAVWLSDVLANPSSLLGGIEEVFTDAVDPIFSIVPVEVVVLLAVAFTVGTIGFTKTTTAQDTLARDGKRALIGVVIGSIVVGLAANPFMVVNGVANTTSGLVRDVFSGGDTGGGVGGSVLMDTFLRPITQMINFNTTLDGSCEAQWAEQMRSGGSSIECGNVGDTVSDPSAVQVVVAILGLLVSLVMLVLLGLGFLLCTFHYVNAMLGSVAFFYAAAVGLARRHNFDLLARNVGFIGAHAAMLIVILLITLVGPGIAMGAVSRIQGDSPGAASMLFTLILLPVFYGLIIYGMWKLAGRTGKLAQFLRVGTNKQARKHYAAPGESAIRKSGVGDPTHIPEAAQEGTLGTLAAWGVGGTGVAEKMMNNNRDNNSFNEQARDQDAIVNSDVNPHNPTPDLGEDDQQQRQPDVEFKRADGSVSDDYNSDYQVFDQDGNPVLGWDVDDSGELFPTTFDAEGEPISPVSANGEARQVFNRNGQELFLFPTAYGASRGTFLAAGEQAPESDPPLPVETANNPYGDDPAVEDAADPDEGYDVDLPDESTSTITPAAGVQGSEQTDTGNGDGEPESAEPNPTPEPVATTFSVPDTTGVGMHGSTITPPPPARYTPPAEVPGSNHPGFGNYLPVSQSRRETSSTLDEFSDLPDQESLFDVSGMRVDPAPETPSAFSRNQPEVANESFARAYSLRDPLSGAREEAEARASKFERLASGGQLAAPVDVMSSQMELELLVEDGSSVARPAHEVNLDGSIS